MFVLSFQITIGVRLGNVCSQFSDYHWSETWRCLESCFLLLLDYIIGRMVCLLLNNRLKTFFDMVECLLLHFFYPHWLNRIHKVL